MKNKSKILPQQYPKIRDMDFFGICNFSPGNNIICTIKGLRDEDDHFNPDLRRRELFIYI